MQILRKLNLLKGETMYLNILKNVFFVFLSIFFGELLFWFYIFCYGGQRIPIKYFLWARSEIRFKIQFKLNKVSLNGYSLIPTNEYPNYVSFYVAKFLTMWFSLKEKTDSLNFFKWIGFFCLSFSAFIRKLCVFCKERRP